MKRKIRNPFDELTSPVDELFHSQASILDPLTQSMNDLQASSSLQKAIADLDPLGKIIRDLTKQQSIFEELQQSMTLFNRITENMSVASMFQQHSYLMPVDKRFQEITCSVTSAFDVFTKQDEILKALTARPEIEDTISKLIGRVASTMPAWDLASDCERFTKLAAHIESVAPKVFADLTSEDASEALLEKDLDNDCKEIVDVLMIADGDYLQFLGNLTKPGSKLKKFIRVFAILVILWQFCGAVVSGYNWFSTFLGKKRRGVLSRVGVYNNLCVVTSHQLNIRAKPSMKGKVIGHLSQGQVAKIVSKGRHWASIVLVEPLKGSKISGFVGCKFLKPVKRKPRRRRE